MTDFIDTNVLLYAYDSSAGEKHDSARHLVTELARGQKAAVSVPVLQEFYVNAVRKIAIPISPTHARERLAAFARWPIHSPMADDVVAASVIAEDSSISFWDAMIIRSAAELGCKRLWTEDLNDAQTINGVEIRSPLS